MTIYINGGLSKYEGISYYGGIEYNMPKEFAKMLLKSRKGNEVNMQPQDFLCKYVNEELGILGNCTKVNQI